MPCGDILAIVSSFPETIAFDSLSAEELADWAITHNAILLAYCAVTTVLPMRIGAVFSNNDAVVNAILLESAHHNQQLAALGDIKEFSVQITIAKQSATEPAESATTGRDFLKKRLSARGRRQNQRTQRDVFLRKVVARLTHETLQVEPAGQPKPGRLLDTVILLSLSRADRLQRLLVDFSHAAGDLGLALAVTGPWPPYSYDYMTFPMQRN